MKILKEAPPTANIEFAIHVAEISVPVKSAISTINPIDIEPIIVKK